MQDSAWTRNVDWAKLLLNEPDKVGMSAAAYIPQRERYVRFQWHYDKNKFGGPSTWVLRSRRRLGARGRLLPPRLAA